ncbi:MAG: PAS domain S-box protein [Halobacteriota archaeon]
MANENQTILLVEDCSADARLIQELLQGASHDRFNVIIAPTLAKGLDALSNNNVDAVLLDLGLPDSQGLATFKSVYAQAPQLPIIMLTILDDEELARTAVREGAQDYLTKDVLSKDQLTTDVLVRAIQYAIERKHSEEELKQFADENARQARMFDAMLSSLPDPIYLLDTNERYIYVCPQCERVLGVPREALIGKTWQEARISYVLMKQLHSHFNDVMTTGRTATADIDIETPTGLKKYEYDLSAVFGMENNIEAVVLSSHDITERIKAEARLKESADEFRALFERSPVAKIRYDVEGYPTNLNEAALALFGVFEVAAIQHVSLFSTPRITAAYKERLLQGQTIRYEQRYDFNDVKQRHQIASTRSDVRYFDCHITPLSNEAGVVKEYIGEFVDITERKNAERAVQEAREEMQSLNRELQAAHAEQLSQQTIILDAVHDAIIMRDEGDRITFWNKGAERLYGWRTTEATGQIVSDLLKTEYTIPPQTIKRALKKVGTWNGELIHTTKDGRQIVVECRQTLQYDAERATTTIFEINNDITERKRAEEKLRAASLYARSLIEASLDPLVTINAEGKITDANKATEEVTGYARDELIGSDFSDYFTDPEEARRGYRQVFAEGFVKDYALAIQNKSGTITDVMYNATIYRDEAGKVQGVFAAARDITELRRVEEELQRYSGHLEALVDERTDRLKESEQKYRTLVQTANNIILTTNAQGILTFINDYGASFFGYTPDELIGQDVMIIVPEVESTGRPLKPLVKRILASPAEHSINLNENVTKDGRRVWIQWANENLIDRAGRHIGHLGIGIDFTDLRKTEKALKNAERLAGIGETAAMIGHDLRNPLQALQYVVDLQKLRIERIPPEQRGADDWERESELFDKISEQVFYMNKIVGDLQDFARPIVPEKEEVDIKGLIENVVKSLPPSDGVHIEVRIPNLQVLADPHLLHRVFANLMLNAIQAMPGGGKLTVSAFSDGVIAVCVSDTGTGIQEDFKDKLFKPLFTGKAKGTGLGLAVVKRIVDAHNGEIIVDSEVGKGSTFTVKLPIVEK